MSHRLLPLVVGAFAIGSETFMISGVLPTIAGDLGVSPSAAGSLVTAFALAYAFGSPLLAVASAGVERKRVLMVAMGAFAAAKILAAFAPSFLMLAAARVLLALAAGAFMPAATAFATAMHGPAERGRAIALIYAGMTLATVVGLPAGTFGRGDRLFPRRACGRALRRRQPRIGGLRCGSRASRPFFDAPTGPDRPKTAPVAGQAFARREA